jgi:hypothetical protein
MDIAHRNDRSQALPNINWNIISLKSVWLKATIKMTLHNALNRSVITHACPNWEFMAPNQIATPSKQCSLHN